MMANAENHAKYLVYINSPYMRLTFDEAVQAYANFAADETGERSSYDVDVINEGLLLFKLAESSRDENRVRIALEYWANLYEQQAYKNPVTRAYQGALQAMLGGAVKGVTKKIEFSKKGMEILREANELAEDIDDDFAIGYVAFLAGNTYSFFPTFFKEFKKETPDFLKRAQTYLKKAKKKNIYAPELDDVNYADLIDTITALNNLAFGRYYEKRKNKDKAMKYYEEAHELSENMKEKNNHLSHNINKAIESVR